MLIFSRSEFICKEKTILLNKAFNFDFQGNKKTQTNKNSDIHACYARSSGPWLRLTSKDTDKNDIHPDFTGARNIRWHVSYEHRTLFPFLLCYWLPTHFNGLEVYGYHQAFLVLWWHLYLQALIYPSNDPLKCTRRHCGHQFICPGRCTAGQVRSLHLLRFYSGMSDTSLDSGEWQGVQDDWCQATMGTSLPPGGCIKNPSKPNSVHCTYWLLAGDHCLWPWDSLRSDNLWKNALMVTGHSSNWEGWGKACPPLSWPGHMTWTLKKMFQRE